MEETLRETISELVRQATGEAFRAGKFQACHGGCIHQSGICSDGERSFFVKLNALDATAMFRAEAEGLRALAGAGALRVPGVIGLGVAGDQAVLVLEALDLGSRASVDSWHQLGEGLAQLHRHCGESHGWEHDNFIGRSPQSNRRHVRWSEFFMEQRLRPQFEMAESKGMSFPDVAGFLGRAGELLAGHEPRPSLLHGDLWSGNVGFTVAGEPVIFDPAVHYGDRECDLAFSEFFGGFAPEFYQAYRASWPLDSGYTKRRDLYNLYHVLNHANLFGGGYVSQARALMQSLTG